MRQRRKSWRKEERRGRKKKTKKIIETYKNELEQRGKRKKRGRKTGR